MTERLWTYDDIASYLQLPSVQSVRHVFDRDPTAPKPIKIGSRTNRFVPDEIREWVLAHPRSMDEIKNGPKSKRGRPAKAQVPR